MKYSIKGWVKNSFCDWDSKITSVIFLTGCNLRCPFCQNWQLIQEPQNFEDIDLGVIKEYLDENKDFIDGVVITGGEPFVSDFIFDIIREIKKINMAVKVDTNGTFPDKLKFLIDSCLIDGVAMDIKNAFEPQLYSMTSGILVDDKMLGNILSSAKIVMNSGIDYEFRTTLVRSFHTIENIRQIAMVLKGAKKYVLQQYRKIGVRDDFDGGIPFSREEMEKFRQEVSNFFEKCCIRYYDRDT
ncbi:MAG: anaerobic ribonucleoside-triphosphate reductase activating protein [Candidatus Omnitrophica bacterium]|nr:anaerobic ribonucleoside-triphosphate reductase activating protein [Candidatus Omnitrophota bacterium]MCM8825447.1 anaerobic ribonucleoside-triphosphate reductase activating protein [Candidatus Omnitrophota bacterium]